jgi:hypothetical protein
MMFKSSIEKWIALTILLACSVVFFGMPFGYGNDYLMIAALVIAPCVLIYMSFNRVK